MKNMINAAIRGRAFQRYKIRHVFDDAYDRLVAAFIRADRTAIAFRQIATPLATPNRLRRFLQCVNQRR